MILAVTKGLITFILCHNCFAFVLVGHCITATSNQKVRVWESTTPKEKKKKNKKEEEGDALIL